MGLLIDSTLLIRAERNRLTPAQLVAEIWDPAPTTSRQGESPSGRPGLSRAPRGLAPGQNRRAEVSLTTAT